MATGKDILIKIQGDAGGFSSAARQAEQAAGRFADSMGRLRGENGRMAASGRQAENALGGIGAAAKGSSGGIGVFGVALGNLAAQGITMAISGLQQLGASMIGYNAKMEQARIGFTSLLGSADAAGVFIQQMQDFAAKTPFEFPQVQEASKKFLAFGFAAKDVIPTLTAVGDAVSALGGTSEQMDRVVLAMGQIKSKGRVQGEELLQLAEAGIPAYQILADKLGLTGQEVANIGEKGVSAEVALKALTEGMSERFGGMMEAQSKSFLGMVSNIKDATGMLLGGIGEGAFEALKSGIQSVVDLTGKMADSFRAGGLQQIFRDLIPDDLKPTIAAIANAFSNLGETVYAVASRIGSTLSAAFEGSGSTIARWIPILERVASALAILVGGAIDVVIRQASIWIRFMGDGVDFIISAWGTLGNWFNEFAQALGAVFTWLMDNVVGPVADAFGSSAETVAGLWDELKNWLVEKTVGMVRGILDALGPVGKIVESVGATLAGAWDAMTGPKNDGFDTWAAKTKKTTTNVAKGLAELGGHAGRSMEQGAEKAGKAGEKMEKDAERVSKAIEKEWAKETETKLQLLDKWQTENLEALEKTAAANETYERDKQRIAETYAARKTDLLNKMAKEERESKEATVKALAEIDKQTSEGYLGHSAGSEGKLADMDTSYQSQIDAIDALTAKRKEANAQHLADYGTLLESEVQIDQDANNRKLAAYVQYRTDRKLYEESAQAVEDDLKAARDANDLAAYAQKLTDENAMKLVQQQEQQTMMDMLYQWQMEAHASMTSFMLRQADQVKNSLAAGIAQSIVYGKNLGQILGQIGKQVAAAFIEMMVKQALAAALGQALQKAMMASTIASAASIASAWAPAAFLAAVATKGAATAFGGLAIGAAMASSAIVGAGITGMGGAGGGGAMTAGGIPQGTVALAGGGITTGPTYALIGEGRYQEAVIPLDRDTLAGLGLGGGPSVTVTQNNYGDIHRDVDYERIQAEIGDTITSAMRGG